MIKIAIVACLAALAAAEADADAWYGPYGYSNWGNNMMYGNNWNMNYWNRPGMQEGYRFHYGKRSAEAEPEAEADAWYGPYGYSNWGNNMMYYGNNWNMYNWNRPSYTQYRTFYHKRSADAEPKADAWYGPYGYSNWGNNWMYGNNMYYNNWPNMYYNNW